MPLLSDLTPSEAAILSLFIRRATILAGTVVIAQGGRDADLYLIEDGQAEVRLRHDDGHTTTLATLGPGDFFGEIAFVTGAERTADVVALTDLTLYSLGRDGYAILSELTALEELTRTAQARAVATRAVLAQQGTST